jgi:hypothetical protein
VRAKRARYRQILGLLFLCASCNKKGRTKRPF